MIKQLCKLVSTVAREHPVFRKEYPAYDCFCESKSLLSPEVDDRIINFIVQTVMEEVTKLADEDKLKEQEGTDRKRIHRNLARIVYSSRIFSTFTEAKQLALIAGLFISESELFAIFEEEQNKLKANALHKEITDFLSQHLERRSFLLSKETTIYHFSKSYYPTIKLLSAIDSIYLYFIKEIIPPLKKQAEEQIKEIIKEFAGLSTYQLLTIIRVRVKYHKLVNIADVKKWIEDTRR